MPPPPPFLGQPQARLVLSVWGQQFPPDHQRPIGGGRGAGMLTSPQPMRGGGFSPPSGALGASERAGPGDAWPRGCPLAIRRPPGSSLPDSAAYQGQKPRIPRSCLLHPIHTAQSASPLNTLNPGAGPGFGMSPLLPHLCLLCMLPTSKGESG